MAQLLHSSTKARLALDQGGAESLGDALPVLLPLPRPRERRQQAAAARSQGVLCWPWLGDGEECQQWNGKYWSQPNHHNNNVDS